jgi:hypothetical protein
MHKAGMAAFMRRSVDRFFTQLETVAYRDADGDNHSGSNNFNVIAFIEPKLRKAAKIRS